MSLRLSPLLSIPAALSSRSCRIHATSRFLGIFLPCVLLSCTSPPDTLLVSPQAQVEWRGALMPDLLYVAVQEIAYRCDGEFGQKVLDMYDNFLIDWGDPSPYEYASAEFGTWGDPGGIVFDASKYSYYDLEMLIADIFHEAAHSLLSEPDGPVVPIDLFGRYDLNSTSYDDLYAHSLCPSEPSY